MLELAHSYGGSPVSGATIAERQHLSVKYLEQLITALRTAGLIYSTRGAKGGYNLAKPPGEIGLLEIFHVLEGSAAPVHCVDEPQSCPMQKQCVTRDVWRAIRDATEGVLNSLTLQELVERYNRKNLSSANQYNI
ncbi:MAG: Rrf2 family transcriptional regulator [Planctomycetia bacterium]|nr:Rrf2 family transcriptional regulator [Planctomycetia bacterium]